MKHAAALGLEVNLNAVPAARELLGHSDHVIRSHPAMAMADLAEMYAELDPRNVVHRALMFYVLSGGGTRLKPIRTARMDQVKGDVLTIRGSDMKGRRGKTADFRLPLTAAHTELLAVTRQQANPIYLFPSPFSSRNGMSVVSDRAIEKVMQNLERRLGWSESYRPHGIRATFRTWAAENNPSLYAVAEAALAHSVGSLVERTYQRTDFLEERRELLERWVGELHA
jgi:integrase